MPKKTVLSVLLKQANKQKKNTKKKKRKEKKEAVKKDVIAFKVPLISQQGIYARGNSLGHSSAVSILTKSTFCESVC